MESLIATKQAKSVLDVLINQYFSLSKGMLDYAYTQFLKQNYETIQNLLETADRLLHEATSCSECKKESVSERRS